MSFMTNGDAALWKQELIGKVIRDSVTQGDDILFRSCKTFIKSLEKLFSPYDAPGDALDAMKHLCMEKEASRNTWLNLNSWCLNMD